MKLSDRVAIVTGSSRGLGYEIAKTFLAEGAYVMLCARDRRELTKAFAGLMLDEPRVAFHVADISHEYNVDRLFDETEAVFGRVDILVNNAAVIGPIGNINEVPWQAFMDTIAINFTGAANCIRRAIAPMKRAGGGKIININGGGEGSAPGLDAYVSAKAALARLTENLAPQLMPHNICINAVSPGGMTGEMLDKAIEWGLEVEPERFEAIARYRAQGATPKKLAADLCAWLASPDSDGLSGRMLSARHDFWPLSRDEIGQIMASDTYTLRRENAWKLQAIRLTA